MERTLLPAGDKAFGASESLYFDTFNLDLPTKALQFYIDASILSTTTPTAHAAENPMTLISEFELTVAGKSRGILSGIDLFNLMRLRQGVEPQYTRTTYADSTAILHDLVLRLDLRNEIPPNVPITVRIKTGAVADIFDAVGADSWTSAQIYMKQEVLTPNLTIPQDVLELQRIMALLTCDAYATNQPALSGTPTTAYRIMEMPFVGVLEAILMRVRNDSALADNLVTDFALVHRNKRIKEWKAEELDAAWTQLCPLAQPTGMKYASFDPDNDRDGFIVVEQGQQFGIGVKHSTVTGTGDLRALGVMTEALYS